MQLSLTPRETASETIENPDIVKIGKARTGNGDRRKQLENPGKQQKKRDPRMQTAATVDGCINRAVSTTHIQFRHCPAPTSGRSKRQMKRGEPEPNQNKKKGGRGAVYSL